MNKEDAIKFLQQFYPNGGHRWLDEQRIEAIGLAVKALQEESVSIWHDVSEEPDDMSHCLIFYGCKESVGHYLHYEPVLYNKKEKMFVTSSFPHPTGYKVEQKSFDGGCVAEVYKNRRDRISISDITQWCYLYNLHNLSNIEKTEKCGKEEPVSDDFEMALAEMIDKARTSVVEPWVIAAQWKDELVKLAKGEEPVSEDLGEYTNELSKQFPEVSFAKLSRIAVRVVKWQKEQIEEVLLSEVLPCFMHGGEADEVVAKLDEVLNQKK